jgi:N-acyl-D-amino-acid deacylase
MLRQVKVHAKRLYMADHFDLLIRDATVIDGTGRPRYRADIGVKRDRIERIDVMPDARADVELQASGRVAAPGFIDSHTHDDRLLLSAPSMTPKISQGVTTVVTGNCGISLAPSPAAMTPPIQPPLDLLDNRGEWFRFPTFDAYVQELRLKPATTNCALLVGHTTVRAACMDDLARPAKPSERMRMQKLVREALVAGAIGASSGLYYEPAFAAPTDEVIDVFKPLREFNGLYCTHMRNEADDVMDALDESFQIGRELGVPVVLSHHKVSGVANYGRSKQTLAHIDKQMARQPIHLDCYPYTAASSVLSAKRISTASRVVVSWSEKHPEFSGWDLRTIAESMGATQEQAVERLLPAGAIYFAMDEDDVRRVLAFPHTMIGSDGLPHDTFPHPRLWGTFPRVLGHYCRELGLFSLEEAIHKMTGLTAKTFGLADRGTLAPGAYADVAIFDPVAVTEGATFQQPITPAIGIDTVIVNGEIVWREGRSTGARPGRILERRV